ncbi:MAG TPA: amidohydrolase family protein [Pyrinomonadaceae bacterium]|nr:amidohydrolase family protein [Pyrinomonadaceae bacterium]
MRLKGLLLFLLVLVLQGRALPQNASRAAHNDKTVAASPVVAFVNVNVVPMDKEGVLENQTVIISDGRISEMGAAGKTKVPQGATRIEGKGRYLLPGLVDMHAHLYSPGELPLYLANGVTTVYNLNGRPANLLWRADIEQGKLAGPTIYSCGPTIRTAQKADEARRLVEEQKQAGYDSIKIYNGVSKEAYDVLIAEARRHGLLYIGHIPREPGFESVLAARQAVAHAEEYVYTTFKNKTDDESRIPEVAAATAKAGVQVVPTFVAYDHIIKQVETLPALLAMPEMKYLAPWVRDSWGVDVNPYKLRLGKEGVILNKSLAFQKKLVRELHRQGVRLMTGTDAMNPGVVPGFSEHEELRHLVEIGLTPFEALRAATRYPGEFLTHGRGDFGTVAVGKRADLLLVEANPLQNIGTVARPLGVMARGRWMPQTELRRMLEDVPALYAKQVETAKAGLLEGSEKVWEYLRYNDPVDNLLARSAGDIIVEQGIEKFRRAFDLAWKRDPKSLFVQENFINTLGYYLVAQKRMKEAIDVFKLNVATYPKSGNTYDSLAEAYMNSGDKERAIEFYRRAIEVEPNYANATAAAELIKRLGGQ